MKAIERLNIYLRYKNIRPTSFESEVGLSSGYLSKQKTRLADIGESVLVKITKHCPDLNPTWLLTGKEEMLLEEPTGRIEEEATVLNYLKEKDARIESLVRENEQLKTLLRKNSNQR